MVILDVVAFGKPVVVVNLDSIQPLIYMGASQIHYKSIEAFLLLL